MKISKRISSYIYGPILMQPGTNTPYHIKILACAFFCDSSNFGFLVICFLSLRQSIELQWEMENWLYLGNGWP